MTGITDLFISQWVKKHNDQCDLYFYEKVLGEHTKNHSRDSENIKEAGYIPFFEDEQGTLFKFGLMNKSKHGTVQGEDIKHNPEMGETAIQPVRAQTADLSISIYV